MIIEQTPKKLTSTSRNHMSGKGKKDKGEKKIHDRHEGLPFASLKGEKINLTYGGK